METLESLAARISAEHRSACDAANTHAAHARAAGQLLIEVKRQLNRGEWLPWLRQHCPDLSLRTVQSYMQLVS